MSARSVNDASSALSSAWSLTEIVGATGGTLTMGETTQPITGITIDSRRLQPGEAFVAIHGTRFDGHVFIDEALRRRAACLIVSRPVTFAAGAASIPVIVVDDTTIALGQLARFHRRRLGIPVIAVTGSCGKTTTKELIAHLLGEPEAVLKTTGTQNNHIGVPLTLLRLQDRHRIAVVELGSNHSGEIAYLASIVEPNVAVITNIGPVHLEFFGSLMGVLQEKLSLLEALPSDGCAILPGDQLEVCLEAPHRLATGVRVAMFGTTERCDVQALIVQRCPEGMAIQLRDQPGQWVIPLIGHHNVENVLAALACTWAFGLPLSIAKERLQSFEPVPLRSQLMRGNGLTILNDCYNANPLSFARALETLRNVESRRKIVIVGDMLELGPYAPSAHQAIGRMATQLGVDAVIAVGEYADCVAEGVRELRPNGVVTYRTVDELLRQLPQIVQPGDGVLVKGSRKLHLEQVTERLLHGASDAHADLTG